jgi:hypothetical protein
VVAQPYRTRFENRPPCLTGMEACVGAHHLSHGLRRLGHEAPSTPIAGVCLDIAGV